MAFTYDLATDIGKCRLRASDAVSTAYAFEDDEWSYFLTEGGSVPKAVGMALRALMTDAARRQRAYSVPGLTYDDKGRVESIKAVLATLGEDAPTLSVSSVAAMPFDAGYRNPITGTF